MPSADYGGENINFFETGYIIIGKKRFDVEEISINASTPGGCIHIWLEKPESSSKKGCGNHSISCCTFHPTSMQKLY